MNIDGINRINFQRNLYKNAEQTSGSEEVRQLQKIKIEMKIANDEKARESNITTPVTNSPYLPDQTNLIKKDTVFKQPEEQLWREVKSSEKASEDARANYLNSNIKKLNIL